MKILILSFLIGACYLSAFSQYKFTLVINTKTLSDAKGYLNVFNNKDFIPLGKDSFQIVNGSATITGQVKQPSNFADLIVSYKGKDIQNNFVLDSGKNNISLEVPDGEFKFLTLNSDAKGGIIYKELGDVFVEATARYRKSIGGSGYIQIPMELHDQIKGDQIKRLEAYPNDYGSLLFLYFLSRTDALPSSAKVNLATLAKFSDDLRNSPLGKQLYDEETSLINNKIAAGAGMDVRTFKVPDINNKLFSNSSLKGQPYVIVFSATWCGPCQKQLPKLKKLYQTYKGKGLKVVYFNDDDNVVRWKEHVSKNKLTWINVSEKLKPSLSKISKSFGVYAIPTCLVVDKKGMIVYNSDESDTGISRIESYIKKVVND
ncbi:TlpA disulfide reductase family protein [Pedobacter foliorum]|uniref:TlpA disulfide reductase family protein n=1 Tax=Pedobacter foliorum TaxID=2739058 RepID=UPI001565C050|nr:TlpA disulfide reductase family protein [Pedobacter foliorum]NRF40703.1 TlpA family protein disulfide reductase [Pedobacter foliorum]